MAKMLGMALGSAALAAAAAAPDGFASAWRAWHAKRIGALAAPQGWLALVGLHWLSPGENRVPGLPGAFVVADGKVALQAAPADAWFLAGRPVTHRVLATDRAERPDDLVVRSKTVRVIDRGGKLALRVWDADAPARRSFRGVDSFLPDPRWRIEARWEEYPAPREVEVPSVVGIPSREQAPGRAHFAIDGKELALEPTLEDGRLFFVFKDATAPRETYGAGRFLYAAAPKDGKVVLDFNRATNPPCAFTPYATCPLPLPENVLPVRIEAGEKKWEGHGQ
jgi:uncharacterized protein (DUF1684 family)